MTDLPGTSPILHHLTTASMQSHRLRQPDTGGDGIFLVSGAANRSVNLCKHTAE